MTPYYAKAGVTLYHGDARAVLPALADGSADAVVTDPPYGIRFMGQTWDRADIEAYVRRKAAELARRGGRKDGRKVGHEGLSIGAGLYDFSAKGNGAFGEWCRDWAAAALRVLKPGGYLLAFGGTRTFHRLACALEDAGFEIRDTICWLYGSGFPKGRGCLKPAWEPILLCRRPGPKVLPLGIDACRVGTEILTNGPASQLFYGNPGKDSWRDSGKCRELPPRTVAGRWPANVVLDDSAEVREAFAAFGERDGGTGARDTRPTQANGNCYGLKDYANHHRSGEHYGDTGTAARFFYTAKAGRRDRGRGNTHPTVKPFALMEWLVKLACPPGGTVLDPFAGSGSTLRACLGIGRQAIGVELDEAYCAIAARRLEEVAPLFLSGAADAPAPAPAPAPTLFDEGLTG